MSQTRKRLGDLLVEAGLINEDQLHAALEEKRKVSVSETSCFVKDLLQSSS